MYLFQKWALWSWNSPLYIQPTWIDFFFLFRKAKLSSAALAASFCELIDQTFHPNCFVQNIFALSLGQFTVFLFGKINLSPCVRPRWGFFPTFPAEHFKSLPMVTAVWLHRTEHFWIFPRKQKRKKNLSLQQSISLIVRSASFIQSEV